MERAEVSQRKMNLTVSSPTNIMNSSMGEASYKAESFIVNLEEIPLPPSITNDSIGSIEVEPLPASSNTRDFGVVESTPKHLHSDSVIAAELTTDKNPSLLDNTRDNEVVESTPEHHDNDSVVAAKVDDEQSNFDDIYEQASSVNNYDNFIGLDLVMYKPKYSRRHDPVLLNGDFLTLRSCLNMTPRMKDG